MPTLIIAALLGLLAQDQTSSAIGVEPLGAGGYRLTITVAGTSDPGQGQARLAPKAVELCGDAGFTFGRYRFEAQAPGPGEVQPPSAESITLSQDVRCGAEPPAASPGPGVAEITEAEATRLAPAILALSDEYFSAVDEGRDAESLALTLPSMNGNATLADWTAGLARRRAEVGPLVSRTVAKLTWYSNPPDVEPGLYVAADFVAYSEHADECGYLVWFSPNGAPPFRLARQETTSLPHDLSTATVAAMRQRVCAIL
jgi:hypothetical protein